LVDVGVPGGAEISRGVASGLLISQATGGARGETQSGVSGKWGKE